MDERISRSEPVVQRRRLAMCLPNFNLRTLSRIARSKTGFVALAARSEPVIRRDALANRAFSATSGSIRATSGPKLATGGPNGSNALFIRQTLAVVQRHIHKLANRYM